MADPYQVGREVPVKRSEIETLVRRCSLDCSGPGPARNDSQRQLAQRVLEPLTVKEHPIRLLG